MRVPAMQRPAYDADSRSLKSEYLIHVRGDFLQTLQIAAADFGLRWYAERLAAYCGATSARHTPAAAASAHTAMAAFAEGRAPEWGGF